MNQEIKFRAWHERLKKMFSAEELANDQLTLLPTGKFINVNSAHPQLSEIYYNMIPLQYTGKKDKKGKEIYRGGIISRDFGGGVEARGRVDFTNYMWTLIYVENDDKEWFDKKQWLDQISSDDMEIIGNQFENPEFLENN